MTAADPLLSTVILLGSGVIGLAIAHFAHISPILGFFVIGAAIGPQALGLIDNHSSAIHFLAELGVCFLLFDIGLHLSLNELRKNWRVFFIAGVMQFVVVTAGISLLARQLGLEWLPSIVLGAIFSLSSTALVLKILSDEKEENAPVGKRSTEILVFQDMTAILLLVILNEDLSHGVTLTNLAEPMLKMALSAILVVTIGRKALKPLFKLLISLKSDEVITAFALLMVFVASWATQSMGLSLAFGAFLGGLALSESSYSHLVRGEVAPFRSLLLSLFFLSVGINLELNDMIANRWLLLGLLAAFSAVKVVTNLIAFRIAGVDTGITTFLAFLLAQGSEFAFVLLSTASTSGIINAETLSLAVSLIGLSLAVTPLLSGLGCVLSRNTCNVSECGDVQDSDPREVIIVRVDDFGRQLASLLEAERIPYRAHDSDLERLSYAKTRGLNVYFSDLNRPRTLGRASLGKVLAVVSLLEEEDALMPLLTALRKFEPAIPIVAATESPARLEAITTLGIENTFLKNENSMIMVFEALLRALGFEQQRIEQSVQRALELLEPKSIFPQVSAAELGEPQAIAA